MDMKSHHYSLDELSREAGRLIEEKGLSGITADNRVAPAPDGRTIRYYGTLGLIDRPLIEERQARYTKRHLLQLLAIKALQSLSLPLADIQGRLYGRSDDELLALVSSLAESGKEQKAALPVVHWNEIAIEPGLRLMISPDVLDHIEPGPAGEKVRAALAALKSASMHSERRKNNE